MGSYIVFPSVGSVVAIAKLGSSLERLNNCQHRHEEQTL